MPNGLHPDAYHLYKDKAGLALLMTKSLVYPPGSRNLNSGFRYILDDHQKLMKPDEPERLVKYTLDCAIKNKPSEMFTSPPQSFSNSRGALRTTGGWRNGGLNKKAQEDLHTCLAARLNPSGEEVCIWFAEKSGPQSVDPKEYPIREAYWATTITGTYEAPIITTTVWPSKTVQSRCPQYEGRNRSPETLYPAVSKRICGTLTGTGTCGLNQRADWEDCKTGADGLIRCHSTPLTPGAPVGEPDQVVFETRMKCEDWCVLYPECDPPQECIEAGAGVPLCSRPRTAPSQCSPP